MNTNKTDQPEGLSLLPCREKYWAELTDSGKIGRLQAVVKELTRRVDRIERTANDAHRIAEDHKHGPNGEPMMPIGAFNRDREESPRRRDEQYF